MSSWSDTTLLVLASLDAMLGESLVVITNRALPMVPTSEQFRI
jgi:hypothetical protein